MSRLRLSIMFVSSILFAAAAFALTQQPPTEAKHYSHYITKMYISGSVASYCTADPIAYHDGFLTFIGKGGLVITISGDVTVIQLDKCPEEQEKAEKPESESYHLDGRGHRDNKII